MSPNPPDLSIIIVAYNSPALLHATLESVKRYTHDITYELIVVDNASTDSDVAQIVEAFEGVRFVRNDQNVGYAGANNQGMRHSTGRYVALLNPDTLLHNDALSALVRWLDSHPQVGVVGPQLRQLDGTPQPYSYGSAPTPIYLLRRVWSHVRRRYLHEWDGTEPNMVDWVAGTCLVARRAAVDVVGGLDEQFFLYYEDVDWGLRMQHAGWGVMFMPTISVTHVGGGSVGPQHDAHYDRALVRFYGKYYGGFAAAGVWWMLQLYRVLQRIGKRR